MRAKQQLKSLGVLECKVNNDVDIQNSFRVYMTIIQIVETRGYLVSEDVKDLDYAQFKFEYRRGDLRDKSSVFPAPESAAYINQEGKIDPSLAVFYNFGNDLITEQYIKRVIQSAPRIRKFLLVAPTIERKRSMANIAIERKAEIFIQQLAKGSKEEMESIRIEIFKPDELLFNILKHQLVPLHTVLSENQKMTLLVKYKVKESQLPKILATDPVCRFLGVRRGQILKISRKSETAIFHSTYRIVA